MTGAGIVIVVLTWLLNYFGIVGVDVAATVNSVAQLAGVALAIFGQVRREDLKWGIFRK